MPRAKDTKVWNEDLVTAMRSREEQCRQRFSQRQYLWRDGAAAIASVRKDIYQFKTGKIVGLPRTLSKCVEDECRAIIEGNRPVLPEGYIPTTLDESTMARGFETRQRKNPYLNDPYLKRIKMRGGSYAILMAFHFSQTKTMTQKQICIAAQQFCDEEMEPNFYSGRSYGAWSSKKTLVKHGLIKESRTTQMGRQGQVCNGVFEYTLTDNGELFLEALFQKFPQERVSTAHSNIKNENKDSRSPGTKSGYSVKDKKSCTALKAMSQHDYNIKKGILKHNVSPSKEQKSRKNNLMHTTISLSDDDNDDELFIRRHDKSINLNHQRKFEQTSASYNGPNVIELLDSSDEELSISGIRPVLKSTKISKSQENDSAEDDVALVQRPITSKKSAIPVIKLVILIDDRERDHNATPRHMRIELSRHLSKSNGSLRRVWPSYIPEGDVDEAKLNYGDFAFVQKHSSGSSRLPLTIERKRISDLVQRSSRAHHWQQLHRMRDCCEHAILMIEGNTKKASNFLSFDGLDRAESWNPDHHTIDDEHSFYRFLGRALLSSPVLKIVQTKDEQASYRSVGATGLIASILSWENTAPDSVPSTKINLNKLYNILKSRGIPWQISRRVSEELGSIKQLNAIYGGCESAARPFVLVPAIKEACSSMIETENYRSLLEFGTVERWSSAIHSAWFSKMNDPTDAVALYEENKYFANDRAELLTALHRGKTLECAVQQSNMIDELTLKSTKRSVRRVRIECSSKFSTTFPTDVDTEPFYEIIPDEENPLGLILPSVVMQTSDGNFQSNKLVAGVMEGHELVQRISSRSQPRGDYIELSKVVTKQVDLEFSSFLICPKRDRRVLIIRGLGSAMDEAAKKANYRAEFRVVSDLVIAELMLRYNIVVIQAPRLVHDLEMILREFAMACFYYQKTTRKLR